MDPHLQEDLAKRNTELEMLLIAKERELEIEAALERVQSVAMGMKEPADMLEVCRTIARQLKALHVEDIRNVQTAIFYESKGTYMNYEYYAKHDKTFITETSFTNHTMHQAFAAQMLKGKGEFFTTHMSKDELPAWIAYQKTTNVFIDTYLETASSLSYYWHSLGPVALGISTYKPLSEEDKTLFKRFLNVFELSYTRYLDLEQAIGQARESQVQLALERIRARTMAMQKSDELSETAYVLFQQFKDLGENPDQATIGVIKEEEKVIEYWVTMYGSQINKAFKFSIDEPNVTNKIYTAWKENKKSLVIDLSGNALTEFMTYRAGKGGAAVKPEEKRRIINVAFFSKGLLNVQSNEERSEESIRLLERFASVFDQTYTRFLDLQKAEAQAKEAQIEAALEKIRSRSLGMHKSVELKGVVATMFKNMKELDAILGSIAIQLFDQKTMNSSFWVSNDFGAEQSLVFLPRDEKLMKEDNYLRDCWEAKANDEDIINREYSFEQKNNYFDYVFANNDLNAIPLHARDFIKNTKSHICCLFIEKNSALFADSWHGQFYSEDKLKVLKRAAKVFEQAYIRFLDLKQAEAQARESQIQLALERVRARTMAMHKSEELAETAQVLFHQLTELGGIPDRMTVAVVDETAGLANFWLTDQAGINIDTSFKARLDEPTVISKIYQAWIDHQRSLVIDLHGEDLKKWMQFVREEMGLFVKDEFIKDRRVHSAAFFSQGWILVTTHEPQSEETVQILERFASVFNLTYTRFLDLQKAENQAREAEIELALERVRAKTMAMQHHSDMLQVTTLLAQQLLHLGFDIDQVNFSNNGLSETDWDLWICSASMGPEMETSRLFVPWIDHPYFQKTKFGLDNYKQHGIDLNAAVFNKAEKDSFMDHIFANTFYRDTPPELKEAIYNTPGYTFSAIFLKDTWVSIGKYEPKLFTDEQHIILRRFANAFGQAYTRFLDLQKAEAQAREAQIEAALERVRSRSIGMQKSEELREVIQIVFEQLRQLNFNIDSAHFNLNFKESDDYNLWSAAPGQPYPVKTYIPYFNHPVFTTAREAKEKGLDFFSESYTKEEKNAFFAHLFRYTKAIPEERKNYILASPGVAASTVLMNSISLWIMNYAGIPYSDAENAILKRFGKIFEQSYTRFLDLQKAEVQAREAQIEAALERVRSRSLAMRKSDELQDVVHTVFERLNELNVDLYTAIIFIFTAGSKDVVWWLANKVNQQYARILVPFADNPYLKDVINAKENGTEFFSKSYSREEKNELFHHLFENTDFKYVPEHQKKFLLESELATMSVALTKNIGINITSYSRQSFSQTDNDILKRFTKVFDQAYTRFLDLQKSEAQAREARIEAALEKVRARTMGMQRSDELPKAANLLFQQIQSLGMPAWSAGYCIWDKDKYGITAWMSSEGVLQPPFKAPLTEDPSFIHMREAYEHGETFYVEEVGGEELVKHYQYMRRLPVVGAILDSIVEAGHPLPVFQIFHLAFFSQGFLLFITYEPVQEAHDIFKRFGKVFDQTYTRFLDLQKAEAQAREAQIEAALERVRAKVMSMRSSDDFNETIKVFYHQLESLHITPRRCGVGLLNKENRTAELSTINTTADGQSIDLIGKLDMTIHPVLEGVYNGWLKQEEYHPVLRGNEIKEYYKILRPQIQFPDYSNDAVQHGYFFFFDEGGVYAWTEKPMEEAELQIYRRFTSVLNLTYKRYKDLKQAEANAKEAVKQAALDRIRADIASMRSVNDLDRITPLIWNELTVLGIPFIRCGVFLMDDAQQLIHTFLSAPDGTAIGAFHMPYDTPGSLGKVLSHWQKKRKYIDHWQEDEFMSLADILVKQGSIANKEEYLASLPHGGIELHFLPFLQGMLYVGNTTRLDDETIKLLQSVADAFSTAYARYEDFNKLEAAKKQVDSTLNELQATQKQLIQSEKMASLGELTAGIAHEIQNPLNFVNNFSEVSNELIDEMAMEFLNGNADEALGIAKDLKQNLEKIKYHGKRADSIVKGMLQHSRQSSGAKEPTDINALCDEYVRLSYHGMRAKDKSFNAEIKTDFDESIGKINLVPQDIGRVLLNLFNNAFYAVNQKQKDLTGSKILSGQQHYNPTVTVVTKKLHDKIEISVSDNGNGIPQNIIDKIFQPFFTTKPTGQGTGLGLSLAYDIVKAHGGEIKVETKEREGSEFSIMLPA